MIRQLDLSIWMCLYYFNRPAFLKNLRKLKSSYSVWLSVTMSSAFRLASVVYTLRNHSWSPGCVYIDIWCQNVVTRRKKGSYTGNHSRRYCLYLKKSAIWRCPSKKNVLENFFIIELGSNYKCISYDML